MTKTKGKLTFPTEFSALNHLLPLRPINDRLDLGNAMELIDGLALLPERTPDQEDYLETLSTLIEKYEAEHTPLARAEVTSLDALKYLLEANDMNASELGRLLGDRALGSRILNGDRELSKAHIKTLSERFNVSPALFFG